MCKNRNRLRGLKPHRYSGLKLLFLAVVTWSVMAAPAFARTAYQNPDTGYEVIVEDDADLLTEDEEEALAFSMQEITEYGNAAFKSVDYNYTSAESYIEDYYYDLFGEVSGIVFLIDMDNRDIWIYSDGAIYGIITGSYADTITDNVYTYASDGDYYECSRRVFEQVLYLLQGQRIAQPMKYISNAVLAMIISLTICFFAVKLASVSVRPNRKQLLAGVKHTFRLTNQNAVLTKITKKYDPPSSSGGGSSGGGGGGGHSGGGGGHSF